MASFSIPDKETIPTIRISLSGPEKIDEPDPLLL
jgi:hypothetical protein